jgi:hypothetical protein
VVVDVQYEGDCCLVTVDRDRSVRSVTVDEQ